MIARNVEHLKKLADEITNDGAEVGGYYYVPRVLQVLRMPHRQAAAFPVTEYTYEAITNVWDAIIQHQWPSKEPSELRVALWNVGVNVFGSFLTITEKDIQASLEVHVTAGFAFSRKAVLALKENALDANGSRGTLLFTGATASVRGNVFTSAFAAGKFGIRALSQSLAKEFGKENIHVSIHLIDDAPRIDIVV